jgi:hypothetical protein
MTKTVVEDLKTTARPDDEQKTPQVRDTPDEMALDAASEGSFPASDPVSASNITRIEKAPETASAADDHQNKHAVEESIGKADSGKRKS